MKIAVTGASGFIGRELCLVLTAAGHSVVGVTRRKGNELPASTKNPVLREAGAHYEGATQAFRGAETVVHLAGRAHILDKTEAADLSSFGRVNHQLTMSIARAASDQNVRRFVFVSTIGVHALPQGGEKLVEESPLGPNSPYARAKLDAERELKDFSHRSGMELVVVRPPLVYGPGAPGNMGRLVRLVRKQIPLPFGMVKNRRSLIGLSNLCDFLMRCAEEDKAAGETFLVADEEAVSTPCLIRLIAEAMGCKMRLFPFPEPLLYAAGWMTGQSQAIRQLCGSLVVDPGKARQVLGWKAPHAVEFDIARMTKQLSA